MPLPDYILRRSIQPGGVRLAKWPVPANDVAGKCSTCGEPVFWIKINGAKQLNGIWRSGEYFHYHDAPRVVQLGPNPWEYHPPKDLKVPPGNLGAEEYRFWIGFNASPGDSKWAMCRCCKASTNGRFEREAHFNNPTFAVNGDQCTARLVNAYKELLDGAECIVCHKRRYNHQKWGIPLCADPHCEITWKFDQTKYMKLEVILRKQVKQAEILAAKWRGELVDEPKEQKAGQPISDDEPDIVWCSAQGSDGKTVFKPWCNKCRMYSDNKDHGQIHEARKSSVNWTVN